MLVCTPGYQLVFVLLSVLHWCCKYSPFHLHGARNDREIGGMESAHEGFIWSLSWHPLGHILCSGSNDHTRYTLHMHTHTHTRTHRCIPYIICIRSSLSPTLITASFGAETDLERSSRTNTILSVILLQLKTWVRTSPDTCAWERHNNYYFDTNMHTYYINTVENVVCTCLIVILHSFSPNRGQFLFLPWNGSGDARELHCYNSSSAFLPPGKWCCHTSTPALAARTSISTETTCITWHCSE